MIGELKPYPAMKDSGVPWIGKMPSHWTRMPGRACYREEKVLNNGLMETIVLSLSYGFRPKADTGDRLPIYHPAAILRSEK